MTDFRPCPFCGGTEITLEPKGYWGGMRTHVTHYELRHFCPQVGAKSSRAIIFEGLTEEETARKWNRRAHESATPDALTANPDALTQRGK